MKNSFCVVDIETKSRCGISRGASNYFDDESTRAICVVYKIDDGEEKKVWLDDDRAALPTELINFDGHFVAHNWFFEWLFFSRAFPGAKIASIGAWLCTQAMARRFCLAAPRSALEDVARLLKVETQKNDDGKRLINLYSIPIKNTDKFNLISAIDKEAWLSYCADDVRATAEIFKILWPKFSEAEKEVFAADKIQQARGVPIDLTSVRAVIAATEKFTRDAEAEAERIAGRNAAGALVLSSTKEFIEFVFQKFGVKLENAQAGTLVELREATKDENLLRVLELRVFLMTRAAGKAEKLLELTSADGRYRNPSVYGAAHTGRWQSWGVNFFNFFRGACESEDFEKILSEQKKKPTKAGLASLQRGLICSPKNSLLITSDWRGIEFYLSLFYSRDIEQLTRVEAGESPYLIFGEKLFSRAVTKKDAKEYALAKAAVLGLGYGAGHVKFASLAKQQSGIELSLNEAKKIVDTWRQANAPIVSAWRKVEKCFRAALAGSDCGFSNIMFSRLGEKSVKVTLPSGYDLYYRNCGIDDDGIFYVSDGVRQKIYGGALWENLMQAISGQILRNALVKCEAAGLKVVLHVYDEIVVESKESNAESDAKKIEQIMCAAPAWSPGLRLKIEQKITKRWGK